MELGVGLFPLRVACHQIGRRNNMNLRISLKLMLQQTTVTLQIRPRLQKNHMLKMTGSTLEIVIVETCVSWHRNRTINTTIYHHSQLPTCTTHKQTTTIWEFWTKEEWWARANPWKTITVDWDMELVELLHQLGVGMLMVVSQIRCIITL